MYRLLVFLWRVIDAYELLIVVGVILSWVPRSYGSFIDQIDNGIKSLTDPYLNLFRRLLPSVGMGGMSIDFSPIVAIVVLDLIKRLII
ncbi:MAG: YggT family protein [Coriobacteriales bacterium]|nr:YggT family protein [Coriobacteriales bacterium]